MPVKTVASILQAGVTSLPTGTQGQVLYHNGTSWVVLAVGTSGQFLKTQGAAANPAWATAIPGNFTKLETLTFDGTAATMTSAALTAYKSYLVLGQLRGIVTGAGTNGQIDLRLNADAGNNYRYKKLDGTTLSESSGVSSIGIGENRHGSDGATNSVSIMLMISNANGGNSAGVAIAPDGGYTIGFLGGKWISAATITGLTIFGTSNLTGAVTIYGVSDNG